ncbi:MAG: hypothetical protein ABL994_18785, partial [Verrucomicrobiales bacterium]
SSEGVVLGADSTSTMIADGLGNQYFDHQQKIFEIGVDSTLGLVMWGLGGIGEKSYRTMVAELADEFQANPPVSLEEAAQRWSSKFWTEYTATLGPQIARLKELSVLPSRTDDEDREMVALSNLSGGFCLGGRVYANRKPEAYSVTYDPSWSDPKIEPLAYDVPQFWGVPNLLLRLFYGIDEGVFGRIIGSGRWSGTPEELFDLVKPGVIKVPGRLPIREAIDWVFSSIFITIKAIKLSSSPPVCGGPIEIAVITSDRQFRWVKHKRLDEVLRQVITQGATP